MKVFIIQGNYQYANLFKSAGYTLVETPEEADLVCFTGGEDVSPNLYGDYAHPQTYNSERRDAIEMNYFELAEELKIPMVGICRGGQFLNVMSGGRMYQHVQLHTRDHIIIDVETSDKVLATSTHHQMFMPSEESVLVAYAQEGGRREWYDKHEFEHDVSKLDFEVVYYPKTNCLCFQPHPEFGSKSLQEYFHRCVNKYLLGKG